MAATLTFFTLSFFLLFKFSYLLQYVPPSLIIEAVADDEYVFGIEEEFDDDPIERCYYETDTGILGSFEILPPTRTLHHQRDAMHNIMTTLGIDGLCKIKVEKLDRTGPKKWTLTPAIFNENEEEQNLTSVVYTVKFYSGYKVITYQKTNANSAIPLKYELQVLHTKSFYNHLVFPETTEIISCKLEVKGVCLDLDVTSSSSKLCSLTEELDIAKNIFSVGHGKCGLKYVNALFEDVTALIWTLSATDSSGNWYRGSFKSSIVTDFGFYDTKKSVILGMKELVRCGGPQQSFCTLYNPKGEMVVTDDECKYSINSFTVQHLGIWKCYSGNSIVLPSIEYTIEYFAGKGSTVIPIVEETATAVTVGCRVTNYGMGQFDLCKLTAPNNKLFNIKYGGADDRYITLGTDYNKGICKMEIQKPLLEFENGFWKCEIVGPNRHSFGGAFIEVGLAKVPEYKKHLSLVTELEKPVIIYCEVPYTTDFCFIKAPNGTKYESEIPIQITLGRCSFTILSAVASDNGTWVCAFSRETGLPNEEIIVEITVADILQTYQRVEVDAGSTSRLMCHTGGLPISYCQFIAPNGTTYYVRKQWSVTNIQYYGNGLEYGDCGITIVNSQSVHNGYWTCAVSLVRDGKISEITTRSLLSVTPGLRINAAGIGIGVGVTVLTIAFITSFILYMRWRRRRHAHVAELELERQQPDNSSESSSNTEFPIL